MSRRGGTPLRGHRPDPPSSSQHQSPIMALLNRHRPEAWQSTSRGGILPSPSISGRPSTARPSRSSLRSDDATTVSRPVTAPSGTRKEAASSFPLDERPRASSRVPPADLGRETMPPPPSPGLGPFPGTETRSAPSRELGKLLSAIREAGSQRRDLADIAAEGQRQSVEAVKVMADRFGRIESATERIQAEVQAWNEKQTKCTVELFGMTEKQLKIINERLDEMQQRHTQLCSAIFGLHSLGAAVEKLEAKQNGLADKVDDIIRRLSTMAEYSRREAQGPRRAPYQDCSSPPPAAQRAIAARPAEPDVAFPLSFSSEAPNVDGLLASPPAQLSPRPEPRPKSSKKRLLLPLAGETTPESDSETQDEDEDDGYPGATPQRVKGMPDSIMMSQPTQTQTQVRSLDLPPPRQPQPLTEAALRAHTLRLAATFATPDSHNIDGVLEMLQPCQQHARRGRRSSSKAQQQGRGEERFNSASKRGTRDGPENDEHVHCPPTSYSSAKEDDHHHQQQQQQGRNKRQRRRRLL